MHHLQKTVKITFLEIPFTQSANDSQDVCQFGSPFSYLSHVQIFLNLDVRARTGLDHLGESAPGQAKDSHHCVNHCHDDLVLK